MVKDCSCPATAFLKELPGMVTPLAIVLAVLTLS
jgi:hypothetical protein